MKSTTKKSLCIAEGPQETSDWKSEIRTWGGAGAGGSASAELLALQAPQEDDDDDPNKVEDEEASATEEEEEEVDNETYFGCDPDREVDVWVEYQAVMHDPMFAY